MSEDRFCRSCGDELDDFCACSCALEPRHPRCGRGQLGGSRVYRATGERHPPVVMHASLRSIARGLRG